MTTPELTGETNHPLGLGEQPAQSLTQALGRKGSRAGRPAPLHLSGAKEGWAAEHPLSPAGPAQEPTPSPHSSSHKARLEDSQGPFSAQITEGLGRDPKTRKALSLGNHQACGPGPRELSRLPWGPSSAVRLAQASVCSSRAPTVKSWLPSSQPAWHFPATPMQPKLTCGALPSRGQTLI